MNDQLWIAYRSSTLPTAPGSAHILTPEVRPDVPFAISKPRGGYFWTSTLDERGSSWLRWCLDESYADPRENPGCRFWRLPVEDGANVYEINGAWDLRRLVSEFPVEASPPFEEGVDWWRALEFYDGIHLTQAGMWATRYDAGGVKDTYGWDCESTVWSRWRFGAPEEITDWPAFVRAYYEDDERAAV